MIFPVADLPLSSRHRVSQISFHPTQPHLAVQSHDRTVEIFRIRTEDEVRRKQARRRKRSKEKKGKGGDDEIIVGGDEDEKIKLIDLFTPHLVIRASGKIRSFDFGSDDTGSKNGTQLLVALASNALEVYTVPPASKSKDDGPLEATRNHTVELPGHRTDVRTLCLNSEDTLLASASNGYIYD
jgi:U3 small nucleolar RNA-associated protein 12